MEYVLAGKDVFAVKNITERECFEQTNSGYQLKTLFFVATFAAFSRDFLHDFHSHPFQFLFDEQTNSGYQLKVFLPYAEKENIDLYQAAADLVVRTGNFKRSSSTYSCVSSPPEPSFPALSRL